MSGAPVAGTTVQKVYADPLGRNACLRTAFLLGHFLGFLNPAANFSEAQKDAMRLALDKDSNFVSMSVPDLLRGRILELGVTGADGNKRALDFLTALSTNDFLEKFERVLSTYIDTALQSALQGSGPLGSRSKEFRSALRASLEADRINKDEIDGLSDEDLIARFSGLTGHQSCYVHMEILSHLFGTQIITHGPVTGDGNTYNLKPSITGLAGQTMAGEACHLLGGAGHFDLMVARRSDFSAALMSNYTGVSSVQTVNLVSVDVPPKPKHIPAAVASAVRGGGGTPAGNGWVSSIRRAYETVRSNVPSDVAQGAVLAGAALAVGAVSLPFATAGVAALCVKEYMGGATQAQPASSGKPSQTTSGAAASPSASSGKPARGSVASSPPSGTRDSQAIKKPANPNNEFALGTKKLSEDASTQASVDTGIITTKAPVVDIAFLDLVSTKQTTSAPVSKQNMDKISQADDYIAAVYQAALLKNPDASFDEVKSKIQQHQVAGFLDSNGLKQAAVFYKTYQAAPMANDMIPGAVQP